MGWDFTRGASRADVIRELTAEYLAGTGVRTATIAKQCVGNVLWTVKETTTPGGRSERWIGCYLLEKDYGWGYKAMDESMGPYYYSCPLAFLDMAPEVTNAAWRAEVRAYHSSYADLAVGDVVERPCTATPERH